MKTVIQETADPMIEKLQRILDAAVMDRDDFYRQYSELINTKNETEFTRAKAHRMYIRYEHQRGYVEGMTNVIFAAGYNIVTAVDSNKLTITK